MSEPLPWHLLWKRYPEKFEALADCERKIGYTFRNRELLYEAMTHRSALEPIGLREENLYGVQNRRWEKQLPWNERLEFLGDAALDLIVTTMLYEKKGVCVYDEGRLSQMRASLVCESRLAEFAEKLSVATCLAVSNVQYPKGSMRVSMLADSVEALIGAIYKDSSYDVVSRVVAKWFKAYTNMDTIENADVKSFKVQFQEWAQRHYCMDPTYEKVSVEGPPHARKFRVRILVDGKVLGEGNGQTIKGAEAAAAEVAWKVFVMDCEESGLVRRASTQGTNRESGGKREPERYGVAARAQTQFDEHPEEEAQPAWKKQRAAAPDQPVSLSAACHNNDVSAVLKILQSGGPNLIQMLNQRDSDTGYTTIMIAAECGHSQVVATLARAGADVNFARPDDGITSLLLASQLGHAEVVSSLVAAGADVNLTDQGQMQSSPLMECCKKGWSQVVRILIDNGANVDYASPKDGSTALMMACHKGYTDIVRLLLDAGANPSLRMGLGGGLTAYDVAQHFGRHEITAMLKTRLDAIQGDNEGDNGSA